MRSKGKRQTELERKSTISERSLQTNGNRRAVNSFAVISRVAFDTPSPDVNQDGPPPCESVVMILQKGESGNLKGSQDVPTLLRGPTTHLLPSVPSQWDIRLKVCWGREVLCGAGGGIHYVLGLGVGRTQRGLSWSLGSDPSDKGYP